MVNVIVTLPSFTPVTTPFSSTVATEVSDELQVPVCVAIEGLTVAVSFTVSPTFTVLLPSMLTVPVVSVLKNDTKPGFVSSV